MSQVVLYLDPSYDLDVQRLVFAEMYASQGIEAVEEHIGGRQVAQESARKLGVPLYHMGRALKGEPAKVDTTAERPQTRSRRRKAFRYYEGLEPSFREAQLLGITTLSGIAEYLTERGVPTPNGRGEWSAAQVKRAKEWISADT